MVFEEQEITLTELAGILKKHWLLILIPSIIAAGAASIATHVYFSRLPVVYAAQALIKVGGSPAHPFETTDAVSAIMQSPVVCGEIATAVVTEGFSASPAAVAGSLRYSNESNLLKISAFASRPELAAAMVNAAVRVVVDRHHAEYETALKERDELVTYVKETAKPLAVMFSNIAELRISPTVIVAPATVPATPVPQSKKSVAMPVFAFTAFLMSLIAVYLHSTQKKASVPEQR